MDSWSHKKEIYNMGLHREQVGGTGNRNMVPKMWAWMRNEEMNCGHLLTSQEAIFMGQFGKINRIKEAFLLYCDFWKF